MKRSVLIVAEGEHELSGGTADAALPILVKRLLGDGIDLRPTAKRIRELSGHMHPGRGNPLGRKFIGIIRWAERHEYDAVVILIDQDDDPSRHQSASFAQESAFSLLPRAIGIAVQSLDAWFLADHAALSKVLGTSIQMQPDPERNNDPKSACQGFTTISTEEIRLRDSYSMMAAIADLDLIKKRCPIGFGVFAARVASLS
ncbi:MAG: hypothetical protein O2856_06920 [Planctomycetota bacterium]|nr:hypothetical protein [Planctomycetota bacterium]